MTIYLDGHELAFDYAAAKEKNFADTDYPEDWHRLTAVLDKLKWLVFVKEKGVLSVSMRDELQQYIASVKNQCADIK